MANKKESTQRALDMTYDRILDGILAEWLARHSELLQASQNYGEVMRAALDEFINRHAKEFMPVL